MSNVPRRLTRAQIAGISTDQRVVRVIEQLIDTANDAYDMAAAAQTELDVYTTPLALDIQIRDASYAVPTSPSVIIPASIETQLGIAYDASTGVITLPQDRPYNVSIGLNVNTAAARAIYSYVEVDYGSGWVAVQYSGIDMQVPIQVDGQVSASYRARFPAGTNIRFYMHASGAGVTLVSKDVPGTTAGTVIVPAYRLTIAA
jgi:hypothetical protein